MLYTERKERILQHLALTNVVKISELTKELCVSNDTIRRDLKSMEDEGLVQCIRGGACLPDIPLQFSNFTGREIVNIDLKREAAKKALSFIHNDDIIMLNSGTTNTILAQELIASQIECTVITNNIAVISVLMAKPSIKAIILGGTLDNTERSVYGSQCELEVETYYPDICFLSINALHPQQGFTDFRFNEIPIMKIMSKQSRKTVAIMDSSKLGKVSKKSIFKDKEISTVVMDSHINKSDKSVYLQAGIKII